MEADYILDKTFDGLRTIENPIVKGDYEACTFTNCDLSNSNLSGFSFLDCSFRSCNLSSALLGKTALKNIAFHDCKLLGLRFDHCSEFLFEVSFGNCTLNLSSFYKMKLKKTKFWNCVLHEVDFSEADLEEAVFDQCDLHKAVFDQTRLIKADLRAAFNYSIDPERNQLKKAKFSLPGVLGLLGKYGIEID